MPAAVIAVRHDRREYGDTAARGRLGQAQGAGDAGADRRVGSLRMGHRRAEAAMPPPAEEVTPGQVHADDERGADEQGLNAGRGAVVNPVDRAAAAPAGHVERKDGHQPGRGDRPDDGDRQEPLRAARPREAPAKHSDDDQRPEQVELLLHAQRPHVQQRGRVGEGGEVALAGRGEVPVRRVEQRREGVAAHPGQGRRRRRQPPDDDDDEQDQQQRGQQPARPPDPKVAQRDGAGPPLLAQQQAGDEIAGEHEEHVDAQKAAASPRHPGVVEHDSGDGESPQSVQRR